MTAAVDPEAWKQHAECRGMNPDLFLPPRGDNRALAAAKTVCGRCPVRQECLDYALDMNERTGVWGGTSERQRREMRRDRGRNALVPMTDQVRQLAPQFDGVVFTAADLQKRLNLRSHSGIVPALKRLIDAGEVECVRPFVSSQKPSLYQFSGGGGSPARSTA